MVNKDLLRSIPSVDILLNSKGLSPLCSKLSKDILLLEARELLDELRRDILEGKSTEVLSSKVIEGLLNDRVEKILSPSIRKVINATGVVIHTNLGRSILPTEAIEALSRLESGFVNLEYDLEKGARGERDNHVEELLCRLTGAEAALLVNNNAAALLLVLNTLAEGKEVVCSRGEFIEIGGSFRLPDIIEKSGCLIKAVGTTNRTHLSDYEKALTHRTGCFLKVHASNYKILGFSSAVALNELVELASKEGVPVVEDLGSGALVDLSQFGLPSEPTVKEQMAQGADIVTFSGDKLLGGPQAGIVVGKKHYINAIRRNPLRRALRCGRLTLTAFEATLKLYCEPGELPQRLPVLKYLTRTEEDLRKMGVKVKKKLKLHLGKGYAVDMVDGASEVGGGSLPLEKLPTSLIAITHETIPPHRIFKHFLESAPPIIGRVEKERFLLDLRCIEEIEDVCPKTT